MDKIKTYYGYNKNHKSKNFPNKFNKDDRNKPYLSIPSAEELLEYEEITEGSAERIVEMFEAEQIHRHEYENKSLKANNYTKNLAIVFNAITAICIMLTSIYFVSAHNDNFNASLVLASGFALLAFNSFLRNYRKDRRFNRQKHFKNNYKNPRNSEEPK
ncbi:MAG: DUF2335 domain-containing protein [Alphaproteobacteria bacterium]